MYSEADLSDNNENIKLNLQVFDETNEVTNSITALGGVIDNIVGNIISITINKKRGSLVLIQPYLPHP